MMIASIWTDIVEGLGLRLGGPFRFRFIIQPLVAIALGVRNGLQDAHDGKPPYAFGILFDREHRRDLLKSGKDIIKPVVVGIIIDAAFQYVVLERIRVAPAIVVGTLVLGIPYALARGITNRIVTKVKHARSQNQTPPG